MIKNYVINKTPLLYKCHFIMERHVNYVSLKQKDTIFIHLTNYDKFPYGFSEEKYDQKNEGEFHLP